MALTPFQILAEWAFWKVELETAQKERLTNPTPGRIERAIKAYRAALRRKKQLDAVNP